MSKFNPNKKRMDDFSLGDGKNYINSKSYAEIVIDLDIKKNHDITKLTADQINKMKKEKMDEITKEYRGNPYEIYPRTKYAKQVREVVTNNKNTLKDKIFTQEELKQRLSKKQAQATRPKFRSSNTRSRGIANYKLGNGKAISAKQYAETIIHHLVDEKMPEDLRFLASPQWQERQNFKDKELAIAMKLSNTEFYKKYPRSKYGNLVKSAVRQSPGDYKLIPVKDPIRRGGPGPRTKEWYRG